jgi:hypothetical protein
VRRGQPACLPQRPLLHPARHPALPGWALPPVRRGQPARVLHASLLHSAGYPALPGWNLPLLRNAVGVLLPVRRAVQFWPAVRQRWALPGSPAPLRNPQQSVLRWKVLHRRGVVLQRAERLRPLRAPQRAVLPRGLWLRLHQHGPARDRGSRLPRLLVDEPRDVRDPAAVGCLLRWRITRGRL